MHRRAIWLGGVGLMAVHLTACSRSIAPEPSPVASSSAAARALPAPSASAAPRPLTPAPPGPAVFGVKWKGLRLDRPMEWEQLDAPTSLGEARTPCLITLSWELVAGDAEANFSASLSRNRQGGEGNKEDAPWARSWTLAPGERRSASLEPIGCSALLRGLFEPSPRPVTLTVRLGDRVLHRTELRREAFAALRVDLSLEERKKSSGWYVPGKFHTEQALLCDALPATTSFLFDITSYDRGVVFVSPLSPGKTPQVTPGVLPPEQEYDAAPKPHHVVAPGLTVPADACRRFPQFTVTSREDLPDSSKPVLPGGGYPRKRGVDQHHRLMFAPDQLRLLLVDRTNEPLRRLVRLAAGRAGAGEGAVAVGQATPRHAIQGLLGGAPPPVPLPLLGVGAKVKRWGVGPCPRSPRHGCAAARLLAPVAAGWLGA